MPLMGSEFERPAADRLPQSTQPIGIQALFEEVLDAVQAIMGAHLANIQMFYPDRGKKGELRLIGHRGFSEQDAKTWEWVSTESRTTCGEALRTGAKVVVPDIRHCDFMAGTVEQQAYLNAGIHSSQSLPLVSRSGALLGMLTTYWNEPHEFSVAELRALDPLARLAADLIERSRAEESARESEERLRFAQDAGDIGTFESNLETGVVTCTPKFERMYGLAPGSFPWNRAQWLDLLHPADRGRVERRVFESYETGAVDGRRMARHLA